MENSDGKKLPDPLLTTSKDADFVRDALLPEIPRPITPENDEPLGNLMKTLGIENNKTIGVRFLREGPNRMVFVSPKNSLPTYQLFRRTVEADEEVTLDRVVAADEYLDATIQDEYGKFVSGTLPTVEELEKEYLTAVDVKETTPTAGTAPTRWQKRTEESAVGGEEHESESHDSTKIRCIRNALLMLSVQGKICATGEGSKKPIYVYDQQKAGGKSFESGAGDQGKTIIIVPEAAVTFVVSPERKTRVIYNAGMTKDALSNMTIVEIDEHYGKHDITFHNEGQFQQNILQCIETRIDPKDRLMIYPVGSEKNPTPIQKFPEAESLQFLLSIFQVAIDHSGKTLGNLQVADFQKILSGKEKVTWPLGGGHTSGLTILRYVYQELKKVNNVELEEEESIQDDLYRQAKAAFQFLKPMLIEHFASTDPAGSRVDEARTETSNSVAGATAEESV